MVFFGTQKKHLKDAKEFQKKLMEDHRVLTEELKAAHEAQIELEEESKKSESALQKAQERGAELKAEKKEAIKALAEERTLLAQVEAEYNERLKAEEDNKDVNMAEAREREQKAQAAISALEEETKSLHAEEKMLQENIEKHKKTLQSIQSESGSIKQTGVDVKDPLIDAASTADENLKAIREEKAKVNNTREENEKILESLHTAIESANIATKAAEARAGEVAAELAKEKERRQLWEAGESSDAKKQLQELQKQNADLSEEIAVRDKEIEQARNALEVAKQNAEAKVYDTERSHGLAKAEDELKAISEEEVAARDQAEMVEREGIKVAYEVSAAKVELETRQKDMSADLAKWKGMLDDSQKNYAEAQQRLQAILEDKAWHTENLEKLVESYTESHSQTEKVLEELGSAQQDRDALPVELQNVKEAQDRTKQEEVQCQNEHYGAILQARFSRVVVEAQLKDHEDIMNGAQSIPQALDNWRRAQTHIEDELRLAIIEREGIIGQITGLEPVLAEANKLHDDRSKALERIREDCAVLREEEKTVALREQSAADQLKDAKAQYESEEAELRNRLQLTKARLFEARQEHRQLKENVSTAKGQLNAKAFVLTTHDHLISEARGQTNTQAKSGMQHGEAYSDTVDSLRKVKRDTDMVHWLHGSEPRDLVHRELQSNTNSNIPACSNAPRIPQSSSSKLADAGSSIFK